MNERLFPVAQCLSFVQQSYTESHCATGSNLAHSYLNAIS